jgi:hypothetical protein
VFFHLTKNATERHLDVVLALRDAGIGTHLALSTQDFEPRVLTAVRRDNIRLDRALALRRICHKRGIPTFNELILGLPEQTYDSFAGSVARAVTPFPLDTFNLYLARVLENAEMATPVRARYGIVTRSVRIPVPPRGGDHPWRRSRGRDGHPHAARLDCVARSSSATCWTPRTTSVCWTP